MADEVFFYRLSRKFVAEQFVVPEGPIRQSCKILGEDSTGIRTAYEGVHKPGERIEKLVEGIGEMTFRILANNKLIQEQTF